MSVFVLRLGHRKFRDKRVSTHCGLVARAFGADKIFYSGEKDDKLLESIKKVSMRWGGGFEVEYVRNWRKLIKEFRGVRVHLTMYGLELDEAVSEVREKAVGKDVLVVIGGEKVPGEVYGLVDFNLSVGNQPHSEIAALALFLDRLFEGREFKKVFEGGRIKVKPSARGKVIIRKEERE